MSALAIPTANKKIEKGGTTNYQKGLEKGDRANSRYSETFH
jgi:hypothetical protein